MSVGRLVFLQNHNKLELAVSILVILVMMLNLTTLMEVLIKYGI